jgi:hypothetical protein
MAERLRPSIPEPGTHPSPALIRRWRSMPPWQGKRERAKWWRENAPQEGQAAPSHAPAPAAPEARPVSQRRLTNEELARRVTRQVELDDPAFNGTVTEEDLAIASPGTVTRWMEAGVLQRDLGGPPPPRRRR